MLGIFRREVALGDGALRSAGDSVAELFHENTKLHRDTAVTAAQSYSVRELDAMARAYKRYRRHPHVALPSVPDDFVGPPLADVIAARRSRRAFGSTPLALSEVSALLRWTYGITGEIVIPGGGVQRFRAAPSAGALYPAEIYLGVRAVHGLEAGIYHYEVPDAALALLDRGDPT